MEELNSNDKEISNAEAVKEVESYLRGYLATTDLHMRSIHPADVQQWVEMRFEVVKQTIKEAKAAGIRVSKESILSGITLEKVLLAKLEECFSDQQESLRVEEPDKNLTMGQVRALIDNLISRL